VLYIVERVHTSQRILPRKWSSALRKINAKMALVYLKAYWTRAVLADVAEVPNTADFDHTLQLPVTFPITVE